MHTETDAITLRRRSFIACCAGAGIGSSLLASTLWAQSSAGDSNITAEMITHAAMLAGLNFATEDIEKMLAGVRANRDRFRAIRRIGIDQNVPPPLYFNPAVPGQVFDSTKKPFVEGARRRLTRPNDVEEIAFWSVVDLATLIETRQVTATELTEIYLDRIERFDSELRSVITLTDERAREQAAAADAEIAAGNYRGPLHGIPWGAKDLLATRGYRTTWGFKAYEDQMIDRDATIVQRLDDAGAILIAKLSTGEIARGDQWLGIQTKNPWKTDEGSGGSSAGPGSATAAGLVGFSIGTDTSGSIVGPSRTCGITGLRPTFGRISRDGVMPVCWSLDKAGPMCRSAIDCAVVFEAIYGPDNKDLAVVDMPFNFDGQDELADLRIGYLQAGFDREDESQFAVDNDRDTLALLEQLGYSPHPVSLPEHSEMDELQMLLVDEAAAFDELVIDGGIELFRQDIDEPEDTLMRIARLHPAVEYLQSNRRRMLLMQEMAHLFDAYDVVVAPFSGTNQQNAFSLTGHPSVSIPNGFDEQGKPTGIQLVGQLYGEATILRLAQRCQQASRFHLQRPPAFS